MHEVGLSEYSDGFLLNCKKTDIKRNGICHETVGEVAQLYSTCDF